MSDNYAPEFLADLEREAAFVNSSSQRKYSKRFQLKDGESALIRFLPYRFDTRGRYFARIARHWINGRPYLCTKDTDVAFGGDPDQRCEICTLVDDLNNSRDKEVSNKAWKLTATPQWATQILVWETVDHRGNVTENDNPYEAQEFWHYKEGFTDLMTMMKNYLRRNPEVPLSIFDPINGCDVLVTKAKRGYRFEREAPSSISKQDPEGRLEKILKNVKFDLEKPVDERDMDALLTKIEDFCTGRGGSRTEDRRSGGRNDMDVDEDKDNDRGGRSSSRGGDDRRSSSRDERGTDDRRSSTRDAAPPAREDSRRSTTSRSDDRGEATERRSERREDAPRRTESRRDEGTESRREEAPARESRREEPPARESRREEAPARRDEPARESRRAEPTRRDDRRSDDDLPPPAGLDDEGDEPQQEEPRGRRRSDDEDAPPPALSRNNGRGAPPPPPAAGRGGREETEEEDLPSGDKDPVAPAEPKAGEVAPPTTPAETEKPKFQSQLGASLRDRIKSHQTKA
jgi:hypothetical protein